jgi:AmmeMemoRadiSam system protein B
MDSEDRPRLRPLAERRHLVGGEPSVELHDPLGVARSGVAARAGSAGQASPAWRELPSAGGLVELPAPLYAVARWLDGTRTPAKVAREWSEASGSALSAAEVLRVALELSERGLLDDARFRELALEEWRAFKSSPERPFVGAGRDYELSPFDLRVKIGGLVADDWDMPPTPDVFGLITPSCNVTRAGRLYARSYAALRHDGQGFARVLLLGQLRARLESPIVPLDRPFATPFGAQGCDLEAVRALAIEAGIEELAHRGALELERQILFLRLLFPKLPVVPVLASAADPRDPARAPGIERAVEALARVLALPGRTLFVCASDLEHRPSTPEGALATALREDDRECIEHATACDAQGFLECAGRGSRARAASSLAIWLFLRLAAGARARERTALAGTILGYQQLPGEPFVSAASVLFH